METPKSEQHLLDPQDWPEFRATAHRMVDDMIDWIQTIREKPAWQKPPASVQQAINEPLPQTPKPLDQVYDDFLKLVAPYNKGNIHPRFWGWVEGSSVPAGVLAEFLASTLNPNLGIGDHSPIYVERRVIDWCKSMMGFSESASGLLVSGATTANLTGLAVARNHAHNQIRQKGLHSLDKPLTLYASVETHSCVQKSIELLGLGAESLRKIPVDENYRIRLPELRAAIREDRAKGFFPFCIVGNAGTVNTGSIDPMSELLAIAREEKLWFHIDGAFGAFAYLDPEYRERLYGMTQADSLAFDLHKWMYMPYEAACILIRDVTAHRNSFHITPSYLVNHESGIAAGPDPFNHYGISLSKGFTSLKIWMCLKTYGLQAFAETIRQNIAQARYLAQQIEREPLLELMTPVTLNVVCYRYHPKNYPADRLNDLNKNIVMALQDRGIAVPTSTILNGHYVIRAAITNHRSRWDDFDILVKESLKIGAEMAGKETR
ncbi:amino acid decarboxylase [bacterium]|nr:amino acid decarboxylase [bacterium]